MRDWGLCESEPLGTDWVEQLSKWLGPLDAITLQSVQQPKRQPPAHPAAAARTSGSLADDLQRVQDSLLCAMRQQADAVGKVRVTGLGGGAVEPADADFATYRQRYLEHQRRMDLMLDPLRTHCRDVLSRTSADLHQLAELDAAMEQTLGEREKVLLARLPLCLERRFGQHKQNAAEHAQDWVARFEQDFRQLQAAELAFRLEPIAGLVEALHNRAMQTQ